MNVNIHPYIVLDGKAKEVVDFYSKALGAEVMGIQSFGDMPDNQEYPTPPEMKERVLHDKFTIRKCTSYVFRYNARPTIRTWKPSNNRRNFK